MNPSIIPPNYVQVGPNTYAHRSRVGSIPSTEPQPDHRQPQGDAGRKARGKGSVGSRRKLGRVTLIACRNRELDDDNLAASFKFLRDAIADSLIRGLPAGVADSHFNWEYGQCQTRGTEGTVVKIEMP